MACLFELSIKNNELLNNDFDLLLCVSRQVLSLDIKRVHGNGSCSIKKSLKRVDDGMYEVINRL